MKPPPSKQPGSYTGDTLPLGTPAPSKAAQPRATTPQGSAPHIPPRRPVPDPKRLPAWLEQSPPTRRPTIRRTPIGWRKILTRLAVGGLLILVLACIGLMVLQQQVAKQIALHDARQDRPISRPLMLPMNILLLGVDSRPDHADEGVRSDTMLLLHLDPAAGSANLLAIPRDSWTTIPNYGEGKINVAFDYGHNNAEELFGSGTEPIAGAAALSATTAEHFLGLTNLGKRVDYIATINFDGFAAMIDALGGIDINVPNTIVDDEYPTPDYGTMQIVIPAGLQHFDGAHALQYVRTRHADSDFNRGQRQQQVLHAMIAKLRNRPLPLQPFAALRLLKATGGAIRTTFPVGRIDALLFGAMMLRLNPDTIGQYRIDPDHATLVAESGSDLIWDPASIEAITRQVLSKPVDVAEQATIQVQNSAQVSGLAGRVSASLAQQEYTLTSPETGEPAAHSMILTFTGKDRIAKRLQKLLRGIPIEQRPSNEAPMGVDILIVLGDDYEQFLPQP